MKIWKITCCRECPKLGILYVIDGSYNCCYMNSKKIDDIYKLPKWCTLPDYEEDYNENNN